MSKATLHIIADSNIWGATYAFSAIKGFDIQLDILEHQDITPNRIKNADILLVRSSTKVNQTLLHGSRIRFVGTATIGDDHVDKTYLQDHGIGFSSAAGSSTESVVEFMVASLLLLQQDKQLSFSDHTLGIIGVGRIGSLLDLACQKLNFKTLYNDPPRQHAEGEKDFHSLGYLLEHADVLTLHTPLTKEGKFKTTLLLGEKELSQFKGRGIINAGRGACLDNAALLTWLNAQSNRFAVLDCWENEPGINLALLNHPQVRIATPHIAGHSLDGKAANTLFVYHDLCKFIGMKPDWDTEQDLPAISTQTLEPDLNIQDLAQHLYPINHDTTCMKEEGKEAETFTSWFQHYRRNYPIRRSWRKVLAAHADYDKGLFF